MLMRTRSRQRLKISEMLPPQQPTGHGKLPIMFTILGFVNGQYLGAFSCGHSAISQNDAI
jgi:hypothetical protein